MFHVWFIPVFLILVLVVLGFYMALKFRGGTGVRTQGRTLTHEDREESDLPPE